MAMYYSDNSTNPDNDVINSIKWISGHIFCLLYYAQSKPVPLVSDHTSPILLYRKEMHACDMSILIKIKTKSACLPDLLLSEVPACLPQSRLAVQTKWINVFMQ